MRVAGDVLIFGMNLDYEPTGATALNGDDWIGERDGDWWLYQTKDGAIYESKEIPAYRIKMDNATQILVDGKLCIAPIHK